MLPVSCLCSLQVEEYLTADMTPHTYEEAAKQSGHIPSNTADVTRASGHGPGAGSKPVQCASIFNCLLPTFSTTSGHNATMPVCMACSAAAD